MTICTWGCLIMIDRDLAGFVKQLGFTGEYYTPRDVRDRVDTLLMCEREAARLRKEVGLYQLALKVSKSEHPLTDLACYWDSHSRDGSVMNVGCSNLCALCKELEQQAKETK